MKINTVTVIGANGTMGSNVGGILASFGNARVYMVSRDIEKSKKAAAKAVKSVRADSIASNLIPADYSMLNKCISESDLIFESVAEDFEIKLTIIKQLAKILSPNAIICSGTSGLSITTLSEAFPQNLRSRYFGMHFFNPPYNMTLCEVIPTKYTDRPLFDEIKSYLSEVLFRTVVESKDSPAFIGNRIGFQFINKALQFSEKYKQSGGVDYIDAILGAFSGRSMPPLITSDFVGLDVHKAIVDNIYKNTNDYAHEAFVMPSFADGLIGRGHLGRKTNAGLYKTESDNGKKRYMVYDIASGEYRDKINYNFLFIEQMIHSLENGDYRSAFEALVNNRSTEAEICLELLLEYIIYSLFISENVGNHIASADDVMSTGFNWCPPLALITAFSAVTDFEALIKERLSGTIQNEVDIKCLINRVISSKYDYRPYFKAKK